MCILFLYNGTNDPTSDYKLILASNRDEHYNRNAQCMAPWNPDATIYGGRDLQTGSGGGTWMAINVNLKKIGVLLNLSGNKKQDAISRGKIVTDYVENLTTATEYFEILKTYDKKCNGYVLVTLEYGGQSPIIHTYNNKSNEIQNWSENYLGFSNSLPSHPLQKVTYGIFLLREICQKYKKMDSKKDLIEELIGLLKNRDSQLPDPQLEQQHPSSYIQLSSIFVKIQEHYGTRAHTIFILKKNGHADLIEFSMESPIDAENPIWVRSDFEFNVENK